MKPTAPTISLMIRICHHSIIQLTNFKCDLTQPARLFWLCEMFSSSGKSSRCRVKHRDAGQYIENFVFAKKSLAIFRLMTDAFQMSFTFACDDPECAFSNYRADKCSKTADINMFKEEKKSTSDLILHFVGIKRCVNFSLSAIPSRRTSVILISCARLKAAIWRPQIMLTTEETAIEAIQFLPNRCF